MLIKTTIRVIRHLVPTKSSSSSTRTSLVSSLPPPHTASCNALKSLRHSILSSIPGQRYYSQQSAISTASVSSTPSNTTNTFDRFITSTQDSWTEIQSLFRTISNHMDWSHKSNQVTALTSQLSVEFLEGGFKAVLPTQACPKLQQHTMVERPVMANKSYKGSCSAKGIV